MRRELTLCVLGLGLPTHFVLPPFLLLRGQIDGDKVKRERGASARAQIWKRMKMREREDYLFIEDLGKDAAGDEARERFHHRLPHLQWLLFGGHWRRRRRDG
jgi:hypothetical protein